MKSAVWINFIISISFTYISMQQIIEDADDFDQHVDVNEGDDVSIECNTTVLSYKEIYWTKNKTNTNFHRDGLFLNFTRINRTDSGEYICNSFDNKTQVLTKIGTVTLNVSYKAEVNSIRINSPELTENDTYTVICDIEGNPPPVWHIRNIHKEVLDSAKGTGIFVSKLIKAKCGDTGPVVCDAENSLNTQSGYMSENITVYCSPRPASSNAYIIHVLLGSRAVLTMNLLGFPYPNCTWSRDDGHPIRRATQTNQPLSTVLSISNMTIEDLGNYSVTMENSYGSFNAQFQLKAWGFPEMPNNLKYSDVTWNSVRMYWSSGFDMGARQHFIIRQLVGGNSYKTISDSIYDNSSSHGIGQNWTFLQTGLESDTDITLTVQSMNEFGLPSHYLHGVTFHTLSLPEGSNKQTNIIIGSTVASVTVIAAVIVVFLAYRQRKKMRNSTYVVFAKE